MDLSAISSPASLALLVDGENLSKDLALDVLREISRFGSPQVRRVYGNLNAVTGWEDHGFRLCPTRPGKNSADMLLCVEAMALALRDGFDTLVIASSDRDFSYLAEQLREMGKRVIGVGRETAPKSFRTACYDFALLKQTDAAPQLPKLIPATRAIPRVKDILSHSNRPDQWGTVAWVGHCLRQGTETFDPATYGKASTEDFLRSLNAFDFRTSEAGELMVRYRATGPAAILQEASRSTP